MTIETNGAVSPDDALAYAARILQDQLNVFVNFEDPRRRSVRPNPFRTLRSIRPFSRKSTELEL